MVPVWLFGPSTVLKRAFFAASSACLPQGGVHGIRLRIDTGSNDYSRRIDGDIDYHTSFFGHIIGRLWQTART